MIGNVDEQGRALLTIPVLLPQVQPCEIKVWIDTGFNGELVLPQQQIEALSLKQSGTVKAILADGSQVALQTYTCMIEWFGEMRELEVVANSGVFPLLGVGLLSGHDLRISYRSGEIELD